MKGFLEKSCPLSFVHAVICLFYRMNHINGAGITTQDTKPKDSQMLGLPCSCFSSKSGYKPNHKVQNKPTLQGRITLKI